MASSVRQDAGDLALDMAASDEFGAFGSTRERLTAEPFVAVACPRSRCGRCQEVDFHIDRAAFDLDRSKPPEWLV